MLTISLSPVYPAPDVYSDGSNEDSLHDLTNEDDGKGHTDPSQMNPKQFEKEGLQTDP